MANSNKNKIRNLVAMALFTALAYVCCVVFHFKVSFLSFDLKDAVMAIGGMMLGPVYGLGMSLAVALIEFITISTTGVYGLIMNVISSVVFVCVGSIVYSRKRDLTGAVIGMSLSVISTTAAMMLANYIITPFYMGVTRAQVVELIPTLLLPFNATKTVFNSAIVFLLYKPFSNIMRSSGFLTGHKEEKKRSPITPAVLIAAAVVAALALIYFFGFMNGVFEIG